MIFGLTGLIGSGKTAVADVFVSLGAMRIDADQIGREVVENDPDVLYQLLLAFGPDIVNNDQTLDRRALGQLAFASQSGRDKLNSIVHPALLQELDTQVVKARANKQHTVVDAALLVFWGYHKHVDVTILVTASEKDRISRMKARGFSADEIRQRSKSQLSLSELRQAADYIINNNKDLKSLQSRASNLYRELTKNG